MQRVHFQVQVSVFNCQQMLANIYFVIFDIVISRMWFSVELLKFHWFGINWNCPECRNCCLYFIIQKILLQAKSGKYFQIWFFPRFGGKNGGVLSMRMQVILDSPAQRKSGMILDGESRRPCSSVGRVTVDLIRRSWVRFPPRSKDFFFASCGSLFPFTRANAQWVIHGFM